MSKRKTTSPNISPDTLTGYDPARDAGDCWFDEQAADRAEGFFADCLRHSKGEKAGQLFILEPWQKFIVRNLFGWKRPDGTRRYREAFIFVPRKNGKTCLLAGMVVYALCCDGEPGAEIYSAAADQDQAALIFAHAKEMVLQEPEIAGRCKVLGNTKTITREETASFYRAISSEAASKHGYNSHFVVVDELHAQPDRELVDVLATSTGARRQPMTIYITTAGDNREGICYEKYDYACKVRDGLIRDPGFLPVIFEIPKGADWADEKVWAIANPNLGVSVSIDYLRREFEKAKSTPSYENTFRRLFLNQWTEQDTRWLQMDAWNACPNDTPPEELEGQPCWAGLDLSSTRDLSAFVLAFKLPEDGIALVPHFFAPENTAISKEKLDRVPYMTWSRQGFIELTPGDVIDYSFVRARIKALAAKYSIMEIAFDPWNATDIVGKLVEDDGFSAVEFRQGFASMSPAAKNFERLMVSGRLRHFNNPVLAWMANNVSIQSDPAGNIKPNKAKSRARIDGIVAAIMAIARAELGQGDSGSVYDERGVIEL